MYKLLDGKSYSLVLKEKLNLVFKNIANENIPTLGILQVGNLEESNIYIKHKITMANSLGIKAEFIKLHENANYDEIANGIKRLSNTTNGLIIQLPMQTTNLTSDEKNKLLNLIPNEKDIDGLNDFNLNSKYTNNNFLPATAKGIILLLKKYDIAIDNQNIAIVGFSNIVGRPLYNFFLNQRNNIVTKYLKNTSRKPLKDAHIIIVATGQKNPIFANEVANNTVIVDVGIHRDENKKISGDLDFDAFSKKASYITPVPGGVGPMTVISLVLNLIKAYLLQFPEKTLFYNDILNLL
ncbi:bifunctional protein FolD [Metamycoplasma salivarium]|uniref:Bifunctional protein FolD n=2 Tax=Metamycoplasma salivarium TaxID=2124 RepID=A0A448ZY12_METSV|nr:bifunctional 5,10-methylenetetrahydrofolate dehydrogenase/5,10-methenyltetrahydrofolate cyclohydrolase [Metamycoplasma salivarium]CAD7360927.1 methylenetetrahydrofolate dehydrogenase [Metamycoplasma salivarium]VEU56123.1 methylenetetrahydrofolate dehydrogenase [Metamycoplasma salivarium]GIZ05675.1 bifunctional protein FolD [Metamycoplasma salivarium]GIZ06235.1 bifunctional protein FolD [Metamycoplasma salivarium]GIZ06869.1 bifunctional protein FolD [Metamycoplasma salivarium]